MKHIINSHLRKAHCNTPIISKFHWISLTYKISALSLKRGRGWWNVMRSNRDSMLQRPKKNCLKEFQKFFKFFGKVILTILYSSSSFIFVFNLQNDCTVRLMLKHSRFWKQYNPQTRLNLLKKISSKTEKNLPDCEKGNHRKDTLYFTSSTIL